MGRYISIEKAIADTKDAYYHALVAADSGWHANENDSRPFIGYLLGVVLSCYRDFDSRVGAAEEAGARSTSYDVVRRYSLAKVGTSCRIDGICCRAFSVVGGLQIQRVPVQQGAPPVRQPGCHLTVVESFICIALRIIMGAER